MDWMGIIGEAIEYIEKNITEKISVGDVAGHVYVSPFYLNKGFSMLCGYTLTEYIRNRRLSLAGEELLAGKATVIETAIKYGYDSPDSFSKAFSRFHGMSPSMVRKESTMLKTFAPMKLTLSLKGGYLMDYRITKKESFTVLAFSREFYFENSRQEIPKFWGEHYASENNKHVCGMFGISADLQVGNDKFAYLIADLYNPAMDIPDGCITRTIPALTWAVFPCRGAMPNAIQEVNDKIFSEWLPSVREYELDAGYCIELYDSPDKYEKGTLDDDYYTELWVPVRKK